MGATNSPAGVAKPTASRVPSIKLNLRKYGTYFVLLGLMILFSAIAPNFSTSNNIILLLRQSSFTFISAVGLTFVMISGGMDLSIGAQIVLTNVLTAIMMARLGVSPLAAIPLCLLLGTLLGLTNGFLAVRLRVHPLIITLGTMTVFKGLGYIAANGSTVSGLPDSFKWFGQGYIGPIPVPIIIMIIVGVIGWFVLTKTYFGRYIFGRSPLTVLVE